MKNIKKPSYAINLGKGIFVAASSSDWRCKYCGCHPSSGMTCNNGRDWQPTGTTTCSVSPTGYHVWERN